MDTKKLFKSLIIVGVLLLLASGPIAAQTGVFLSPSCSTDARFPTPIIGQTFCFNSVSNTLQAYTVTGWVIIAGGAIAGPLPYDPSFDFGVGVLQNGQSERVNVARAITIPANFAGTTCDDFVAPSGSAAFSVKDCLHGSCTNIGTLTYAASAGSCTASSQPSYNMSQGHVVLITGPATADSSLAGVSITIRVTTLDYP